MIHLYSAEVCPFAQRTRALLNHLDEPFELHEIDLRDKPSEFVEISPTGKVPLMVDGDLKLYESMIINAYLSERHGWSEGLPGDAAARGRQRLGMVQWDNVILPPLYASLRDPESFDEEVRGRVGRELDELARTVAATQPGGASLLAFHVAPFWLRLGWLRAYTPLYDVIASRSELAAWMDGTLRLEGVQASSPEKASTVASYEEHYVGASS